MEILGWIDKGLSDVKKTLLFGKYFDSTLLEEGIDVYYFLNPHLGIDIILDKNFTIEAIHFYSGTQEEINRFVDDLPYALHFELSQMETRKILGTPTEEGGGDFSVLYGKTPPWDRYIFDKFALHLQYWENKKAIDFIAIESLSTHLS